MKHARFPLITLLFAAIISLVFSALAADSNAAGDTLTPSDLDALAAALAPLVTALEGKYGHIVQLLTVISSLRVFCKPLFAWLAKRQGVSTAAHPDASGVYAWVAGALDLLASVKLHVILPPKPKSGPDNPKNGPDGLNGQTAAVLLLVCGMGAAMVLPLSGCATTANQAAFKTLKATVATMNTAKDAWHTYQKSGHATQAQAEAATEAWQKYQEALVSISDLVELEAQTGQPLDISATSVPAAATDFLNLLIKWGAYKPASIPTAQ